MGSSTPQGRGALALSHTALLPSGWGDTVGSLISQFSELNTQPAYTPVQRFKCSLTTALAWLGARMVRYCLSCMTLSFTAPRRFIPTLSLQVCSPPRSSLPLRILPQGSRGFYIRAYRASLPPHAPDMLTVRIQAIDGTGTCTLLDSQPCRLLTSLHGHYSASSLLRARPSPSRLSPDFPVSPVIRVPCSVDFAPGRGGLLQLLGASLSSCCRYRPARVFRRFSQLRRSMLPSPYQRGLGL